MKYQVRYLWPVTFCLLFAIGLTTLTSPAPTSAHWQTAPSALNPLVPNVEQQFADLALHGDPLAMRLGIGDDASTCRHYQSVNRVNGPDGTPYMILTRSGSDTGPWCGGNGNHYPGELLVVRMGSRPTDGERLRTNRLQPDKSWGDTVPPEGDEGVVHVRFNGGDWGPGLGYFPPYSHPGGSQLIGDLLVVPLEDECTSTYPNGNQECEREAIDKQDSLMFIDVSNPEKPHMHYLAEDIISGQSEGMGVVGVVHLGPGETGTPELAKGGYLFLLSWGNSTTVRFAYALTSDPNNLHTIYGMKLLPAVWQEPYLGEDDDYWRDWQTMNLVRDISGAIYIVAAEKDIDGLWGYDHVSLFSLDPRKIFSTNWGNDVKSAIGFIQEHNVDLHNPDMGSLDAASSLYISPSGQMIFYTGPHDNESAGNNIELGEFRSKYVTDSHTCGPRIRQFLTQAPKPEGTPLYDPGPVATLVEPWVTLFPDTNTRGDDDHVSMSFSDQYDDADALRDDWTNFNKLGFHDDADSLIWCGSPGSVLTLSQHDSSDPDWAKDSVTLTGSGQAEQIDDLEAHFGDGWHDAVDSIQIDWARPDLTYTLVQAPEGAILTDTNKIAWRPSEAQGPGTHTFKLRVCETGDQPLCDEKEFTYTISEVNQAPALAPIANRTVRWGDELSVNTAVIDADIPVNSFTYSLTQAPQGAIILPSGRFAWKPAASQVGAHTVTVKVCDNGAPSLCGEQTFAVQVEQRPATVALSGDSAGQYSDQVTLRAALTDGAAALAGKPVTFSIGAQSATATTDAQGLAQTTITLAQAQGGYQAQAAFAGDKDYLATSATGSFAITTEAATLSFDPANTVAEQVAQPGGTSGSFSLTATIQEVEPDAPAGAAAAGEIGKGQLTMQLLPLGPGSPVTGSCVAGAPSGAGYGATLPVSCSFSGVPVNTYTVAATATGGYYAGSAASVVTIFDPSLGSTSGGGWLNWTNGDRVNFSFTTKYVHQDPNPQVNLQVMRQSAGGGMYRLRSTSLQGLSMGEDSSGPLGWATFTGKASYQEPGWSAPQENYTFTVYVEDRDDSADRFWIEVRSPQGAIVDQISLSRTPQANALGLQGGNIRVPHRAR